MTKSTGEKVPKQMHILFAEITALTDAFCSQYLNAEYADMSRKLTAALCRKRPSPLVRGKAKTWACGIVHAIGLVNFLYDSSQTPHIKATELYKHFGVGQSTGQGKSKQIRDMMKMSQMSPDWCLPSRIDDNPLIWMVSVNGFILDIRHAPREVQEQAFLQGIIPYIPDDKELESEANHKLETNEEYAEDLNDSQIYDSSWDEGNDELWEQKYAEWSTRDWSNWLLERLTFPFQVERQEDLSANPFEPDRDQPFSVGHEMKVLSIEDEDESYGIIIKVREGRKTGYVPLADVEVVSQENPNFWLVREYVVWFANR
ncbi:MAG: DUF6398 domain-containing protein [Pleurocapsa sp. MO_226.B13]|nr:DUF6398 domain-containing protein [Pleurocapsa sp. MO_226.B13]